MQTGHEWCRLLHLARDSEFGFEASSILMSLWEAPPTSSTPFGAHPVGTPCQSPSEPSGPIEVTVTPSVIASPDGDFSNLDFTIYTGDFTMSKHSVSIHSDENLQPLTMCARLTDTLVATVWGWRDSGDPFHQFILDQSDTIRRGVTRPLAGPGFAPGFYDEVSPDMTAGNGDWIVVCADQLLVRGQIDLLIAALGG